MFTLDFSSRLPIYEQLYQSVLRMGALGALEDGEPLPSVRAVAQELGVNPNTVQKAYGMLERDGIILSVPGKGSFFAENGSAARLQRKNAEQNLEQALRAAAESGMRKEEIMAQVSQFFSGGTDKND